MSYSVHIDRIGADGVSNVKLSKQDAPSKEEAFGIMDRAIGMAGQARQPRMYSVYGPTGELVISYTSRDNRHADERLASSAR